MLRVTVTVGLVSQILPLQIQIILWRVLSLLKASVTLFSLLKLLEKAWWEKATRAQSLNLTNAESCWAVASLSTITNNLLPFHFFFSALALRLPLRVAHGNVLKSCQNLARNGQECQWTLLALLYDYLWLSYNNSLLEGEKINGEKMLKTKMAEEGRVFKKSRWEQVRWKQGKD